MKQLKYNKVFLLTQINDVLRFTRNNREYVFTNVVNVEHCPNGNLQINFNNDVHIPTFNIGDFVFNDKHSTDNRTCALVVDINQKFMTLAYFNRNMKRKTYGKLTKENLDYSKIEDFSTYRLASDDEIATFYDYMRSNNNLFLDRINCDIFDMNNPDEFFNENDVLVYDEGCLGVAEFAKDDDGIYSIICFYKSHVNRSAGVNHIKDTMLLRKSTQYERLRYRNDMMAESASKYVKAHPSDPSWAARFPFI